MDTEVMSELTVLGLDDLSPDQKQVVEKAWRKLRDVLGSDYNQMRKYLLLLARHYEALDKITKAEAIYRLLLALAEKSPAATSDALLQAIVNLADFHYMHGHYARAMPLYERALELDASTVQEGCDAGVVDEHTVARLYLCRRNCTRGLEQVAP